MSEKTKILSKDQIFAKKGLDPRTVYVEEWGGDVLYRPMSMTERREVRKKCSITTIDQSTGETKVELDVEKLEVLTLVYCVLDPDDSKRQSLMFNLGDVDTLESHMAAGGISTVAQQILRASGLGGNSMFRGEKKTEE